MCAICEAMGQWVCWCGFVVRVDEFDECPECGCRKGESRREMKQRRKAAK